MKVGRSIKVHCERNAAAAAGIRSNHDADWAQGAKMGDTNIDRVDQKRHGMGRTGDAYPVSPEVATHRQPEMLKNGLLPGGCSSFQTDVTAAAAGKALPPMVARTVREMTEGKVCCIYKCLVLLVRDVIYILHLCYDVSVRLSVCLSVCNGSALAHYSYN